MGDVLTAKQFKDIKRSVPVTDKKKPDFSFELRANGDIKVCFLEAELLSIKKNGFMSFLSTYLSKDDLNYINSITGRNVAIDEDDVRVQGLIKTYFAHKRAFYGNRKITATEIKRGSQPYKAFVKALDIIDTNEVTQDQFMKAQIKGLSFVGVFPKPSQLCTEEAETRLLNTLVVKDPKKESRVIKLSPDDYNLPLSKNNKFQGVYARVIKKEKVSIDELVYCRDVIIARGKKVPDTINLLIEKSREQE